MRFPLSLTMLVLMTSGLVACKTTNSQRTHGQEVAACAEFKLADIAQLPVIAGLPNPFQKANGKVISAKKDWACRRAEIGLISWATSPLLQSR